LNERTSNKANEIKKKNQILAHLTFNLTQTKEKKLLKIETLKEEELLILEEGH